MAKKKLDNEKVVNLAPSDEEIQESPIEALTEPQSEKLQSVESDAQPTLTFVAINNFSGEMGSFMIGDTIPNEIADVYAEGWLKAGIVEKKE